MAHYHHCPSCYDIWKCSYDCTLEHDLEDQIAYLGKQFGAHSMCNECEVLARVRSPNDEKYKTQEFWNWYNGFTKVK